MQKSVKSAKKLKTQRSENMSCFGRTSKVQISVLPNTIDEINEIKIPTALFTEMQWKNFGVYIEAWIATECRSSPEPWEYTPGTT